MKFNEKLTILRKKNGLSQANLADKLGVSRQAISRWELGSTMPDAATPAKARHLLKNQKAKVIKRTPFTIQLLYGSSGYKQPIVLGVDAGSKTIGIAACTETAVLFTAEVKLRNDVTDLLSARREFRRARRNRTARYRQDIFSSVYTDGRVMYLSFDVTIPAGESISVEASLTKDASIDYVGDDKDKDGYDMATRLGSNLTFTQQTASISGYDEIEIVAQNFGFDLANDLTSVTLDLNQDNYWMQIRKVRED